LDDLEKYWECIETIEAQEMLISLKITDYPYMKQGSRSKFFKEIKKSAEPKIEIDSSNKKEFTTSDLAKMLAGGMRG
jgi:hypothetical protein